MFKFVYELLNADACAGIVLKVRNFIASMRSIWHDARKHSMFRIVNALLNADACAGIVPKDLDL